MSHLVSGSFRYHSSHDLLCFFCAAFATFVVFGVFVNIPEIVKFLAGDDVAGSQHSGHHAVILVVVFVHAVPADAAAADEHFICKDGMRYAGMHLIIDLWGGKHLDNLALVKQALTEAVSEIGATLLNIDLHHFEPNGGISGVAVLAESHMSIHTWPEKGYAALDVFVCGDCQPQKAIPVLRRAFLPDNIQCTEMKRGLVL